MGEDNFTQKPNNLRKVDGLAKRGSVFHRDERSIVICRPSTRKSSLENEFGADQSSGSDDDVERGGDPREGPQTNALIQTEETDEASHLPFDLDRRTSTYLANRRNIAIAAHTQRKPNSTDPSNGLLFRCLSHKTRAFLKELFRFKVLKAFQIMCVIYIAAMTFTSKLWDPSTGLIVDQKSPKRTEEGVILTNGTERAIVAANHFQLVCLVVARLSAWFMYPTLVYVFLSKFRATQAILAKSPLSIYMNADTHELHVYCGWTILVCSSLHAALHVVRWAHQKNLSLLISHFSGISGILIITSCLLICIPMTVFRKRLQYEIRKKLHYFFLLFAAALVFHAPRSAIPNGGFTFYVFGTLLVWYFVDATYCCFCMTEKIETTKFIVLPSGVRMTMTVSDHFQKIGSRGGVCYVCLPWIAKGEWHAFSLFENPTNPAERQIFIQKGGDWTSTLHQRTQRETVRPAWIHGPFPSPYDNAVAYDDQILIASGIGITPALSVIAAQKDNRRINLIWAVRDRHLLEFFLRHLYLDHEGWNLIFYTGREPLDVSSLNVQANTNICIIDGRPNLHEVIPNIIFGIESKQGLPENYTPDTQRVACQMIVEHINKSRRTSEESMSDSADKDLAGYASELGFQLSPGPIPETVTEDFLMSRLSMGFCPWNTVDGSKEYVKQLDPQLVLPTWGILYCGGAKMVLDDLTAISEEYKISLHVESFDW